MSAAATANSWDNNQLYSSTAADLLNICLGGAPPNVGCTVHIVQHADATKRTMSGYARICQGYKTLKLHNVATLLMYNGNGTKYKPMTIQ